MERIILGNRYELIERIGGGGMAIVYKARCKLLNRFVAVKILRDEFTNDEEFVKRFRIEAQSAASLSHPNIVQIFDVGHEDNVHYIVMEYIDGITLKDYIMQNSRLDWREAVGIAVQICSAIEHAHKNNIIHRDIKPHNILLTREGIAKVTDFGIARAVSQSTITIVGSTIGSVHYFSPEQARGTITDEKSDLYSLGITIYEMVTGKVPFDGASPISVALMHIQDQPVEPKELFNDIPGGLNDLIMKSILKEKELRYQSATELLYDLQRVARDPYTKLRYPRERDYIQEFPTKKMKALGTKDNYKSEEEFVETMDETDDDEDKDRKGIALGIITGVLIIGLLLFIGIRVVIPAIMPGEDNFTVKDYVGRNFEEVKEELSSEGIEAVVDKQTYSDTVEAGIIISQYPEEDKTLKKGSSISFEVSKGRKLVTIPDVFMRESRLAEQMLRSADLSTVITTEYSDTVPKGAIIKTIPGALEEVEPGTTVGLVESLGPELEQVRVPKITGLVRTEAEKAILESKLKIGKIEPDNVISDIAIVISQYPSAGEIVEEGTAVDIVFEELPDATVPDGGNGSNGSQTTGTGIYRLKVEINDRTKYGDSIKVYVEATPSDTNELIVVLDQVISKNNFPFIVDIPVPKNGSTHVVIKFDGVIIAENDVSI